MFATSRAAAAVAPARRAAPQRTARAAARAAKKTGGVVVSTTDKTAHVLVERKVKHPKYAKQYKITKKFAVHDEENAANVGDVVTFAPCAPKSKRKRHSLTGFIEQKNQNQKVLNEEGEEVTEAEAVSA